MASKAAYKRLTKEYATMQQDPPPFVWAAPDEKNILHWNYIIRGPPDSPYAGGEYFGVVLFPSDYPFKPPGIKMLTPSGRFQPDKKICFSMSDFHPGSWNPAWSVATILTGLLSFMLADEMTTGSITTSATDKRAYAARSHAWNIQNKKFKDAFPDYSGTVMKDLPNMAQKELATLKATSTPVVSPAPALSGTSRSGVRSSSPIVPTSPPLSSGSTESETITTGGKGISSQAGAASAQAVQPKTKESDSVAPNKGRGGGAFSWGQVMWQKWYWGIVFAVAWAVSSRLTGAS